MFVDGELTRYPASETGIAVFINMFRLKVRVRGLDVSLQSDGYRSGNPSSCVIPTTGG
ncbi:hypothetical protein D3OALGA1CA_1826 [Olavius algarvensis associated proteobacterium Delta 3]|nr:hypothetical protein D3OALGA1CA_1826 [Olavius algarvensis associated proteobacterium Delta 3]